MRVPWDQYFLTMAYAAASRSTCPRKSVGAVIVRSHRIIATGYNGSISGLPHCTDAGCTMEDGHCVATVHAEVNAIAQAARYGLAIDGGTAYVTANPCWPCFKALANAGIRRIVFGEPYRPSDMVTMTAGHAGIELVGPGAA